MSAIREAEERREYLRLLREIRDQQALLLEKGDFILTGQYDMATDLERANAAIDTLSANNAAMSTALTSIAAELQAAAAGGFSAADIKALADKAEAAAAGSQADLTQAQTLVVPPASTDTPVTQ